MLVNMYEMQILNGINIENSCVAIKQSNSEDDNQHSTITRILNKIDRVSVIHSSSSIS